MGTYGQCWLLGQGLWVLGYGCNCGCNWRLQWQPWMCSLCALLQYDGCNILIKGNAVWTMLFIIGGTNVIVNNNIQMT